jgi:uncharacterized protein (TIGR02677 family)
MEGRVSATQSDDAPVADEARLDLYRYATAEKYAAEYLAIMRLFSSTILADLSAAEVAAQLATSGMVLSVDEVESRCRQLEIWGNLVRSVRDARVATVADYLRSRSRFQVSKLGGRVHRQVDEILRAAEGAREVARELLGGMVETLGRILTQVSAGPVDAEAVAADVTTAFASQRLFTESIRDFYAYLHNVLSRYDLVGEEYSGFKALLLEYVDLISADVARHAPAVTAALDRLAPHLGMLLDALAALPALTNPDGSEAERSPGRSRVDWEELADWYNGRAGRSGPQQLRNAAERALAQLLSNAKRMLAVAGTGVSRRADLLRLAGWFASADAEEAHRLFNTAFGNYPVRHLALGLDEANARASALTSWWDDDPVEVPMSLRERGDRAARGRTSRVPDPGLDREALLAEARAEAECAQASAAELVAVGALDGARLSPAARNLLLDRLADLLSSSQDLARPAESVDSDLGFTLRAEPLAGAATVVHSSDGTLTIEALRLVVTKLITTDVSEGEADLAEGAGA